MWPKLLFDLLPHFARLMPMADKYLSTRTASEKAQEAALAALAVEVRTEIGKGTTSQADLLRQIQEQTAQIGQLAADAASARIGIEAMDARLANVEALLAAADAKTASARKTQLFLMVLLLIACGLLIALLLKSTH